LKENFAVSGIHLTGEPREEDFVCIATAEDNLASGILSAPESGNAYEYIGANAKSPGLAFERLSVWKQLRETSVFKMLPVAQTDQDGILAFLDSPERTADTSEPDDIVSSDVSAILPEKSQIERPTGCKGKSGRDYQKLVLNSLPTTKRQARNAAPSFS
jgi:hypothetical protein